MTIKSLILASAAVLALSSTAMAGNSGSIVQNGDGNGASIHQSGFDNDGQVVQFGNHNGAVVRQHGVNNNAGIGQNGNGNKAKLQQFGF